MRRKDLAIGDYVWIVLPYEGGRGWATILEFVHMGARVRFNPGSHHIFEADNRLVSLRSIIKKDIS